MKVNLTKKEISAVITALDNFLLAGGEKEQLALWHNRHTIAAAGRANVKLTEAFRRSSAEVS